MAEQRGWAIGHEDETWWSRLKQPQLHAWAPADRPRRLVERDRDKNDADRAALCCYGLLRSDKAEILLRFVDGGQSAR